MALPGRQVPKCGCEPQGTFFNHSGEKGNQSTVEVGKTYSNFYFFILKLKRKQVQLIRKL